MTTSILDALNPETRSSAIARAAELLRAGELVAFPTETVYGLGADAFNAEAIAKVFAVKGRPADNPLIVHVASAAQIERCGRINKRGELLAQALMPGPITLVIPSNASVPAIARAGLSTVAVRVPAHPIALELIQLSGPLVAPSANLSGRPSPTAARHVLDDLGGRIAAVLDGGACTVGIESTVVDVTTEKVVVLRPGTITPEEIADVIGEMVSIDTGARNTRSPGTRYRHYAPTIPVRLVIGGDPPAPPGEGRRRMVLTTRRHLERFPREDARQLTEQVLYRLLREAESLGFDEILVFAEPGELESGIFDRVSRAANGNGIYTDR